MTIHLAEPVLFLSGYVRDDYSNRTPAMLRGSLVVKIAKNTKIKAITLSFRGKARTEWPEGMWFKLVHPHGLFSFPFHMVYDIYEFQ